MVVLVAFAFLSGIVTILSPCILPVLPIVLSGGIGKGKAKPIGIVTGFVISFTVFTLALTAIVSAFGVSPDVLRIVAVIVIVLLGCVMLVPRLGIMFERLATRVASLGRKKNFTKTDAPVSMLAGFRSGLLVGSSLGLVWTPCVGPIMASVIALALTQKVDGGAFFITLAYSLGTAISMFAIIIAGRTLIEKVRVFAKNTATIQKVFGVLMILVGISVAFGLDRKFQTAILEIFPSYGSGLTAIEENQAVRDAIGKRAVSSDSSGGNAGFFAQVSSPAFGKLGDYGKAPEIVTDGQWFNTDGIAGQVKLTGSEAGPRITMESFKGKVVLVDFWTYSCINCIRTIPHLKSWYDRYKDYGFTIIGVHSPEFEFEKNRNNVGNAIKDLGVAWPVVQDNAYEQWNAYSNRYWPAHYFIDAKGNVRYFQSGEGNYEIAEGVIRSLLTLAGYTLPASVSPKSDEGIDTSTPETYLGYARMNSFLSGVDFVKDKPAQYSPVIPAKDGQWALSGKWVISREYISPETEGTLSLRFNAKKVFLVIESQASGGKILVAIDGKPVADTKDSVNGAITPGESRLYELALLDTKGSHILELKVKGVVRLFSFTFG
jgi:cytochrome c biogenesis protein CcdA/thiol-disulfide isomerase/thioredoxin